MDFGFVMEKISVGSKNHVKVKAVENVVRSIWPSAKVIAVEVPHGTNEQPNSDDEAIEGATNRAKLSLEKTGADLGIGIEGHTADTKHGMFLSGWVVAVDKNGNRGIGSGGKLMLPEKVAAEIRNGRELGPVADEFVGEENIKQKQGIVGVLTNNMIPRLVATEKNVTYALARFINPNNYK